MRILIVEDNPDVAETMVEFLKFDGYDVDVAPDGAAALRSMRSALPDLVLCDLGLPGGMSGLDVARACRGDATIAGVRMVAVSGYGESDDRKRALDAGFDDLLVKPVRLDALSEYVRVSTGTR